MNLQSNVKQKLLFINRSLIKIIRGCEVWKVAKFSSAIHIHKISGLLAGVTKVSKHEQFTGLPESLIVLPLCS